MRIKRTVLFCGWALICIILFTPPIQAQRIKHDVTKIQARMTTDEVRNIFGRPHEINTRSGPKGETQQWVYVEGKDQSLFLYFENGIYTGEYSRHGEKRRLP